MKSALINTLTETFEGHAQQAEDGVEYWLARDLQNLLGYTEWRNFQAVLSKARTASEVSGHAVSDHFVDVNKTIGMPKGEGAISSEHFTNNEAVRRTLLSRGIHPEELAPAEDVKKVERRITADEKASLRNHEPLGPEAGDE